MLKFILILIVVFLAVRFVLRAIGVRFFFSKARSFRQADSTASPCSPGKKAEETDYEVLDSRLSGQKRDSG